MIRSTNRHSYRRSSKLLSYAVVAATAGILLVSIHLPADAAESQAAGRVSGSKLYGHCILSSDTEGEILKETFCMGYVVGVIEGGTYDACLPHGFTFSQAKDIVIGWLRDHPSRRHLNAATLIRDALESLYPCQ